MLLQIKIPLARVTDFSFASLIKIIKHKQNDIASRTLPACMRTYDTEPCTAGVSFAFRPGV